MGRLSFVAFLLAAVVATGCGLVPEEQAGLACQRPMAGAKPLEFAPPLPPLFGMTPAEADAAIQAAELDVDVTWRYHYSTEIGGGPTGYSECWCIPPPDGAVLQADYNLEFGQLVVLVERAQPIPGGRAQPTLGWGCDEA
jgi:hypothetical protein